MVLPWSLHLHLCWLISSKDIMKISGLTSIMFLLFFSIDVMLITHFVCSILKRTLYPFLNFLPHSIPISNVRRKSKLIRFWLSLMSALIIMIRLVSKLQCIMKILSLDYLLTSSALLLFPTKLGLFTLWWIELTKSTILFFPLIRMSQSLHIYLRRINFLNI